MLHGENIDRDDSSFGLEISFMTQVLDFFFCDTLLLDSTISQSPPAHTNTDWWILKRNTASRLRPDSSPCASTATNPRGSASPREKVQPHCVCFLGHPNATFENHVSNTLTTWSAHYFRRSCHRPSADGGCWHCGSVAVHLHCSGGRVHSLSLPDGEWTEKAPYLGNGNNTATCSCSQRRTLLS